MRYTKEKSLKSRRPNEKASEMKGRIARGLLSVALVGVLTTIMPFNANANSSNVYYLGEAVNAGKDTGFSENNEITKKDPHYNWTLGSFSVNGYTRVITDDGNPIFLKTVGDEVVLDFQLEQDIDALNNDKSLMIANDKKAYDNLLYKDETAFGRGALIIRKTDAYQNKKGTSQLYTDYLSGVKVGANTQVEICEEGDYEVALDYSIRDKKITVPFIDKTIRSTYNDYKIYFTFSVRNGNCMVFPFDVATGEELTNKAITENGFYLDLAKSRYLEINVKKEVLREGARGLRRMLDSTSLLVMGKSIQMKGFTLLQYQIHTQKKRTVKKIYVGTNSVLKAYMTTGYAISDIQSLLKDGATIDDDGNITIPEKVEKPKVVENVSESAIVLNEANDDAEEEESVSVEKDNKDDEAQFATSSMVGGSICIVLALFIVYLFVKKKKKDKKVNMTVPIDPEESVTEKSPEEDEE